MTNFRTLKASFKTIDLISLSLKKPTATPKPRKKTSFQKTETIEKAPSEVWLTLKHLQR